MTFTWVDIPSGRQSDPDTDINPLGQAVAAHDALLVVSSPIVPTLGGSWVARGAGFPPISYRKLPTINCVHIGGQAQSGTIPNSTIFTLNVGFRPLTQWVFNNSSGVITVDPNGVVSGVALTSAFLQFSAIFPLDW